MPETPGHTTIDGVHIATIDVTCDRRGCPAAGGATTPVGTNETITAALTRCRTIVEPSWLLAVGLTLCNHCAHRPGADQPALISLPEASDV